MNLKIAAFFLVGLGLGVMKAEAKSKHMSEFVRIKSPSTALSPLLLKDGLVTVGEAKEEDFDSVVAMDWEIFPHDNAGKAYAKERVRSQWNTEEAHLSRYYVIKVGPKVAGFALWVVRGGFKSSMSAELERLAIHGDFRQQGLGLALARVSIDLFEKYQKAVHPELNPKFTVVLLTTGSENHAYRLYERAFGVQSKGKIGAVFGPNEYGDEEILLINEKFDEFCKSHPVSRFLAD